MVAIAARIMARIRSYIFLDLETTGLLLYGKEPPCITEITLLGVVKEHFNESNFVVPRTLNKVTLCVQPVKPLDAVASAMTGLTKENLEDMTRFNEKVSSLLRSFIELMPQPSCLLAHNGDGFDFPILRHHINENEFPDVLCADTLKAFKYLKVVDKSSTFLPGCFPGQDSPPSPIPNVEEDCVPLPPDPVWGEDPDIRTLQIVSAAEMLYFDEGRTSMPNTPSKVPESPSSTTSFFTPPSTPSKPGTPSTPTTPSCKRTKRTLFGPSKRLTYKLGDIYKYIFQKDLKNSHSSEGDTQALLQCFCAIGSPIHEWVEKNARPFSSIRVPKF